MRIVRRLAPRALLVVIGLAAMAPTCCPEDKSILGTEKKVFATLAECQAGVQGLCATANTNADNECQRYCSEGKEDGCKGTVKGRQAPTIACTAVGFMGLPVNPKPGIPTGPPPAPPPGPEGHCSAIVTCHCSG